MAGRGGFWEGRILGGEGETRVDKLGFRLVLGVGIGEEGRGGGGKGGGGRIIGLLGL